ncbi:unnamed protein product [Symbiodinium sp. CCMP2592]|nr:unnamed protein product [Symbiodinium sp. CCMP2592]
METPPDSNPPRPDAPKRMLQLDTVELSPPKPNTAAAHVKDVTHQETQPWMYVDTQINKLDSAETLVLGQTLSLERLSTSNSLAESSPADEIETLLEQSVDDQIDAEEQEELKLQQQAAEAAAARYQELLTKRKQALATKQAKAERAAHEAELQRKAAAEGEAQALAEQAQKAEAERAAQALAEQAKKAEAQRAAQALAEQAKKAEAERAAQALAEFKKAEAERTAQALAEQAKKAEAERAAQALAEQAKKAEAERAAQALAEQAKKAEAERAAQALAEQAKKTEPATAVLLQKAERVLVEAKQNQGEREDTSALLQKEEEYGRKLTSDARQAALSADVLRLNAQKLAEQAELARQQFLEASKKAESASKARAEQTVVVEQAQAEAERAAHEQAKKAQPPTAVTKAQSTGVTPEHPSVTAPPVRTLSTLATAASFEDYSLPARVTQTLVSPDASAALAAKHPGVLNTPTKADDFELPELSNEEKAKYKTFWNRLRSASFESLPASDTAAPATPSSDLVKNLQTDPGAIEAIAKLIADMQKQTAAPSTPASASVAGPTTPQPPPPAPAAAAGEYYNWTDILAFHNGDLQKANSFVQMRRGQSKGSGDMNWLEFWSQAKNEDWGSHPVQSWDESSRATAYGITIHGDEGQSKRKKNMLILSWSPLAIIQSDFFAYDTAGVNVSLQQFQSDLACSLRQCASPDNGLGHTLHIIGGKGDWKWRVEWLLQSRHYMKVQSTTDGVCPRCLCTRDTWLDAEERFNAPADLQTARLTAVGDIPLKTVPGWQPEMEVPDLLHTLWTGTGRDLIGSLCLEVVEKSGLYSGSTYDERLRGLRRDMQLWCSDNNIRPSTIEELSALAFTGEHFWIWCRMQQKKI